MFSSNLKGLMQERGVTFQNLVEKSGLSRQTIHKARQDEGIAECRLSTLGRIAYALNVPVKKLFDGEWEPQSHDSQQGDCTAEEKSQVPQ